MRLTSLLLAIACLHVSGTSLSQTVTLKVKQQSIIKVLEAIESQTDYLVIYNDQYVKKDMLISLNVKDRPLAMVLDQILTFRGLIYEIKDKTIAISGRSSKGMLPKVTLRPISPPQAPVVTGRITNENGEPLTGVSVTVKGRSTLGTTTDLNGKYIIDVPPNSVVVFSMVGYENQEFPIDKTQEIDVTLIATESSIEEVVIVGFGKQKKTDMVGAVTSVKPSELKIPSSNLTNALSGRVAGLIAYQRTGEPGEDNAEFFIRGVTTFGYKVDPLILIDNVEVTTTDLARLQVDDIADFAIMKDATSTAVYGARGANGVILISTKEGTEGRAKVSLRLENSMSRATKELEFADPITYMELYNEATLTRNPLAPLLYPKRKIDNTRLGSDPLLYPVTDWKQEMLKDYTMNQRVNLSISGGGKVARYFVSGALNQDNGILKVDKRNNFNSNINLKTYSLRSNVNINLGKTTEFAVRLNGSFDDYIGPINGGAQVYHDVLRANPVLFAPYYPAEGDYRFVKHTMFGNYGDGNYLNPYADMVKGYREYSRSMMLAQLELKQNLSFLTEGLSFRSLANTTRNAYFSMRRQYTPFYYQLIEGPRGEAPSFYLINENSGTEYLDYNESSKEVSSVFYMESALNYNRAFAKHNLSGMLVYIMRNRLDGNAGNIQLSLPYRNLGVSGRFTYAYDSRYYAEFNFGYNGSERFHKSNRYGFFPSAGLAWTVSNEQFWEDLKPIVSNFRLRGTYGVVGNDAIGDPSARFYRLSDVDMNAGSHSYTFGEDRGNSKAGITVRRYSNPFIRWETAYKTNLAIELELFKNLQINADYFQETRKNILMERADIPTTMGLAANISANLGEASGKGVDLSANYAHSFGNGWWLQSLLNFTYATSEYEVYEEPEYDEYWLTRVGYPISIQRGFIAERLFIDDEEVANSPEQIFGTSVVMGGDIKYKDVNGDGKITSLDRVPLGYPKTPEINYGFGFSIGFKSFDVSTFFQGLARTSFWINPGESMPFVGSSGGMVRQNQLLKVFADSYWSEANRDLYASSPRLSVNHHENNEEISTWYMRDGTFLKLKQAEIGYTLSDKLGDRIKIQKLRIYINGSNLLTWSKFKYWDVEMGGNGLGYPTQRVFNMGLQLSF